MPSDLIRDRAGAGPYVRPFLDALDRMQDRRTVRPDHLTDRARSLLIDEFGAAGDRPDAAFSHGGAGLLGDHTHYFDGFALLMSLPMGTAVALRTHRTSNSRLVFEGGTETWSFDAGAEPDESLPSWVRVVAGVIGCTAPADVQVDAAVVSTVPSSCIDAYISSLGMATARVCQSVFSRSDDSSDLEEMVRDVIASCTDLPFSIAHVMTSDEGRPNSYSLVDTRTLERLPVDAPTHDVLGWGFIDVGMGLLRDPTFHREKREQAAEATSILQSKGFSAMTSLRELEHRDLQRALDALPRRLRSIVRHLVTENRRVQKLVAAVRRRDWQMFGALLLMSHASHQKDWDSTNAMVDLAVREAEAMSLEGMYGACMTGRGGCVLIVGQPFIVPRCLDRVQQALREQFELEPDVMLL